MANKPKVPKPPRTAREEAVEGESPADTVLRYIRQLHTHTGLPFHSKDETELRAALENLGAPPAKDA